MEVVLPKSKVDSFIKSLQQGHTSNDPLRMSSIANDNHSKEKSSILEPHLGNGLSQQLTSSIKTEETLNFISEGRTIKIKKGL